jgi:mandelate racemase
MLRSAPRLLIDPAEVGAHLLAAAPTRHWLEYVDWASAILAEPMRIENRNAVISDRPGTGVAWNEDAVKRYRMK